MLQPSESLPRVPLVPAPWSLRGDAWIVLLKLPHDSPARHAFVPAELRASVATPISALMCVDYFEAPCGPYHELLFIPGVMGFADGRSHPSISRILVSTWDSVVNGRINWGIPKDRADFDFARSASGDRLVVTSEGREMCALAFEAPRGPRLPLRTSWVPARVGLLAQLHEGRTYYYQPAARGSARLCRLRDWRFDGRLFPDIASARVLASLRVERFEMTFPRAAVC